jgi:hypothetical protein
MFRRLAFVISVLILSSSNASAGEWVNLFDGKTLVGWKIRSGFASIVVENGVIVGTTVDGSPNTFLCTENEYGDFILEFETKNDPLLNTGVQIRSQVAQEEMTLWFLNKKGKPVKRVLPPDRVYGYQVDIFNEESGISGGIYDETRRSFFLADVSTDPKTRNAHKDNQWNRYRIECRGHSIKTWVNDVQCADIQDSLTLRGIIGLQVHGLRDHYQKLQVRFRNIRIQKLD